MLAGLYDITADQGSTFQRRFQYLDAEGSAIDLDGYTARMQVREAFEAGTILALVSPGGGIEITAGSGILDVTASAAQMEALPVGDWLYDLEIVQGAFVTKLVRGRFVVRAEVTR
jgi:hypothetical protein